MVKFGTDVSLKHFQNKAIDRKFTSEAKSFCSAHLLHNNGSGQLAAVSSLVSTARQRDGRWHADRVLLVFFELNVFPADKCLAGERNDHPRIYKKVG